MKTAEKIENNLFIIRENGNAFIQSYATIVAEIKFDNIIVNGKYSKSTTSHIKTISTKYNLPILMNDAKMNYYKFGYGVKCTPNCLITNSK